MHERDYDAYDLADPKHPGWEDAMADKADMDRKRMKEDGPEYEFAFTDPPVAAEIERLADKHRYHQREPDSPLFQFLFPRPPSASLDNPDDDPALD